MILVCGADAAVGCVMSVGDSVVILVGLWAGRVGVISQVGRGWVSVRVPSAYVGQYYCARDEVRPVRHV